eukprot:TRINITY_DN7288_c0_g4_i1.p1 TRINITY_DN7288_c0_g4~~TRINITY_DN7288_c0_g4_i1.p1  ORF type:complete len:453 (-),score=67.94 TRINITY_DN7288_c0_g4_i1:216-1574(-)
MFVRIANVYNSRIKEIEVLNRLLEISNRREQNLMSELADTKGKLNFSKELYEQSKHQIKKFDEMFQNQSATFAKFSTEVNEKQRDMERFKGKLQLEQETKLFTLVSNSESKLQSCVENFGKNMQNMLQKRFEAEKFKIQKSVNVELEEFKAEIEDDAANKHDELQSLIEDTRIELVKIKEDMIKKFLGRYADEVLELSDTVEDHGLLLQKMIRRYCFMEASAFISSTMRADALTWRNPNEGHLCAVGLALHVGIPATNSVVNLLKKLVTAEHFEKAVDDVALGEVLPKLIFLPSDDVATHGEFLAMIRSSSSDAITKIIQKRLLPGAVDRANDIQHLDWRTNLVNGSRIDAKDGRGAWYEAQALECKAQPPQVFIHFRAWSNRFDEWISRDSDRIAPRWSKVPNFRNFEVSQKVEFLNVDITLHSQKRLWTRATVAEVKEHICYGMSQMPHH